MGTFCAVFVDEVFLGGMPSVSQFSDHLARKIYISSIHYFCNPSNIDGRVYVCMYMVRVRVSIRVRVRIRVSVRVWVVSSMLDRLPK